MAERAVIVHSLEQAKAAVAAAAELGRPVTLLSAEGAAGTVGALWFRELVIQARAEHPDVEISAILDCADQPGRVLGALRHGLKHLRFTGKKSTAATLQAMAEHYDAEIITRKIPALDLLDRPAPLEACRAWLSGKRPQPR